MTDIDVNSTRFTSFYGSGNINDTYFVYNNANFIVNNNFSCQAIVLGIDKSLTTESPGFLNCRLNYTVTFGAGKTLLSITPTQHIWIYDGSGVRDDGTNPTQPNNVITFTRENQSEFLRIFYVKGSIVWSVKYYRLVAPSPIFIEYPTSETPNNNRNVWFDPLTFGEFAGVSTTPRSPNIGLIDRRGFTSRTIHRGFGPKSIVYNLLIDEEDNGAILKLEELVENGATQNSFIVTDREILIDYMFSGIGSITRIWETDTSLLKISLNFQESIL